MRFRSLALFPLLYAVAFIVVTAWLGGSDAPTPFIRGQLLLLRGLALVGCLAAVSAFERGDHLRHAWSWLAVTTVLVLLRDLLLLPPFELSIQAGGWSRVVIAGLGVLGNLALLAGIWLLARSWKLAALELPGGTAGAVTVTVVAAVLAVVVAGPSGLRHAGELSRGDWGALTLVVSAVADILSLCLLAPLLLTALALRGGLFAWPWALITASIFGWLLYDATPALRPLLAPEGFPLNEVFRGLALNFLFAAGLAQRLVVTHVREATR